MEVEWLVLFGLSVELRTLGHGSYVPAVIIERSTDVLDRLPNVKPLIPRVTDGDEDDRLRYATGTDHTAFLDRYAMAWPFTAVQHIVSDVHILECFNGPAVLPRPVRTHEGYRKPSGCGLACLLGGGGKGCGE